MSEGTNSAHDAMLDYLYGTLQGEEKARFEAHLADCARCRAELADFGRVREVAKAALASEPPSARLTGPLHAQLMQEAAAIARKKRG